MRLHKVLKSNSKGDEILSRRLSVHHLKRHIFAHVVVFVENALLDIFDFLTNLLGVDIVRLCDPAVR